MKRIAKIIIVSVIAIAITSVVLTLLIPSHTGEIRQDLKVGDYYTFESNNLITGQIEHTEVCIIGFTEDGNLMIRDSSKETVIEYVETKDQFLKEILFRYDGETYEVAGYATLDTSFGSRFCTIYQKGDYQYFVGEHDIIYKHSQHGMNKRLVKTSLIIG